MTGRVHQISVSGGGVPKLAVPEARISVNGLVGDRQKNTKHHGGPERAVCLFSLEVIERLRAEGHPIVPGAAGENLTIEGLDWALLSPGARVELGTGPRLEIASYTQPCRTIRAAFEDGGFKRIAQALHPGESRVYARVLREGVVRAGEPCRVV
jgi:MOSC domain-containing protein YiiM